MKSTAYVKRPLPPAPPTATKTVRNNRFEGYGKMIYERQIPTTPMELQIPPEHSDSIAAQAEREIKIILDLARAGRTASEISDETGYSRARVVQVVGRFAEYGAKLTPEKPKRHRTTAKKSNSCSWTDEATDRLIELHRQGLPYSDIAARIGVTKNSVTSKVQRLIDEGVLESRQDRGLWPEEDIERMFALRAKGKTWGEIADTLGRKLTACHLMYRREKERRDEANRIFHRMADGGGNDRQHLRQ